MAAVALLTGFWAGRLSTEYPDGLPPDAKVIESRDSAGNLPEPPRIPFAAA